MSKISYILWMVILALLILLTLPYLWEVLRVVFFPKRASLWAQLGIYMWAGVGIFAYSVFHWFVKKNIKWLETFSHEFTHAVVALLFLWRIHSFHAEEGHGLVEITGTKPYGKVPIDLAPYCLPVFTYLLLSIRGLMSHQGLWIYDILIGVTIAFHFFCFKNQTGNYQPDINRYRLSFSYFYIFTALIINFCIIWVAFFPQYNVFTSFWRYLTTLWHNLIAFISFLF